MTRAEIEPWLSVIRPRIDPLERFIKLFGDSLLPSPIMYDSGKKHYGFRYMNPGLPHFCLLKGARAVSALNASIELARGGYTQEIAVLIRTLIECTTHIDYVLTNIAADGSTPSNVGSYIRDYFADFARNSRNDFRKSGVPQKKINEVIGSVLNSTAQTPNFDAERLLSNIYI